MNSPTFMPGDSKLASRDLYSARGYVTGDQFFGRSVEIQQIIDSIRRREVVGVFGLRKTGKTSLLREVIQLQDGSLDASGRIQIFIYQDLEHLPSLPNGDPVPDLICDIAAIIRRRLKEAGLRTQEMADLPDDASPAVLRRALDALLEKIDDQASVILILDEIEYLCPPQLRVDTSGENFQRVRELFGVLRKLVQERRNFGLLLAGLANSVIEQAELYGSPNPFFSFARPLYLRPLTLDESETMLNTIGRRVSLHWTDKAVALTHETTGGHALLLRELASCVLNDQRNARSNIVQVQPGLVHRIIPTWQERVAGHVREVLPHLRRYYIEEAEIAEMLIEDPEAFVEYASVYPAAVYRLEELGIIIRSQGGTWRPSKLLEISHQLEDRPLASILGRPCSNSWTEV